jgi:hypothetical protein
VPRYGVGLRGAGRTLVVVAQVEDDLVEVLQREGVEDLPLSLRVVRHVPASPHKYVTSFFIDSISSFFSSLDPCIQIIAARGGTA